MTLPSNKKYRPKKPISKHLKSVDASIGQPNSEFKLVLTGDYYDNSAQIHVNPKEARKLAAWLNAAADYLEYKEKQK